MNSSSAARSTRIRERAQQSWPALPKTAVGAAAAAASRSASAKTTLADLPPSSSVTRLIVCGGARGDPAADLGRAGEGDLGDVGVLDQALPADAARAGDDVEHALRAARPRARSAPARARVSGVSSAGLRTTVLPAASAGATFQEAIVEREVPGHDQADDAERLAEGHVDAAGDRDRLAEQPLRRAGVVAEGLDHHPDLAARVADRLAGVARLEPRQLLELGRRSRRRGGAAARPVAGRDRAPGRERGLGARRPRRRSPRRRRAAPRPSPARSPARRPRSRPRPSLERRATSDERPRPAPRSPGSCASSSGCQRTPRAKRRSGSSIASIASSGVRPAAGDEPLAEPPTPWWWCDRTASALGPAARGGERAGLEPHLVVAERARRCARWSSADRVGRCWSSVPPQATLSSCMPRQIPSTGMSRSSARARQRELEAVALGPGALRLAGAARRRSWPGRCRRRRRACSASSRSSSASGRSAHRVVGRQDQREPAGALHAARVGARRDVTS